MLLTKRLLPPCQHLHQFLAQRDRLYKLIEYIARGPISNKRLEITEAGFVKLELKTAWSNGTKYLLFTKEEFLEKLAALIPPPKTHLVKWSGVFPSNSPIRSKIVLRPEIKKGLQFRDDKESVSDKPRQKNHAWSKSLAKVFKIDVTQCSHCTGKLSAIAAIKEREQVIRYLKHQGIDHDPPPRAPPKYRQQSLGFDEPKVPPSEPPDADHSYIDETE